SLAGGIGCGVGAARTRRGNLDPGRVHGVLLAATLVAAVIAFLHLVITRDPAHSAAFALILLTSGAFYQDGQRLAEAGIGVLLLWVIGMWRVGPFPAGLAPAGMTMGSAVLLTTVISLHRLRAFRRLQALNLELRDQMDFDPLTGIANRRGFTDRLSVLWKRLEVENGPLALIMVDLDHFKNLNDTRGHGEGDGALRQMGGVLRMATRSTEDLPARLGGEEFGVLLPGTSEEHAILIAERIRDGVQYTHIPNPGTGDEGILTASLGVAVAWPRDGGTPSELVDRADQALYQAKHGGRNRVVVWEERREPPQLAPYQLHFDRTIPGLESAGEG
ncbi:MAG: GGDEF domain-containing protein, partial [bacterium]